VVALIGSKPTRPRRRWNGWERLVYLGALVSVAILGFTAFYPVLAWGRKILTALGPYMRQYWFADDREETPYNRITRNWVYKTSRGERNNVGFGSQADMDSVGSVVFLPSTFTNKAAHLGEEVGHAFRRIVGGRGDVMPVPMPNFVYISGMSYGALSRRAIAALNLGAQQAGIFHNTGEGGLAPAHEQGGDLIFQIGTAKFGLRDDNGRLDDRLLADAGAHPQVRMFEIKLAQGAKPGKGGMLLKEKITEEIARIRKVPMGEDVHSSPRHVEFDDVPGLFDFIDHVRSVVQKPVGIKMVIGHPREITGIAEYMAKDLNRGPDFITIDGGEGGTGAAPLVLASHAGLPLKQALAVADRTLREYGVRDHLALFASGKIATPADVAVAMALGADAVGVARGFMLALGCIQALHCHSGNCPTGIATPDEGHQRAIDVEAAAKRVATYATTLMKETLMLAESCGYQDPTQIKPEDVMVQIEPGRFECLSDLTMVRLPTKVTEANIDSSEPAEGEVHGYHHH
jgi:glutamate synthase domain-containing protein 2